MDKLEADRLFRIYTKAKAEFERICHLETIPSDVYEESRRKAKEALKQYKDFLSRAEPKP